MNRVLITPSSSSGSSLIPSLNWSCLIPFLVCCLISSLKKTSSAMRTGRQEASEAGSWVLGDLLSRNTCVGRSPGGGGVLPCRSGYPEQPRANHYHLASPSMFTAAPGLNGFHMAPRHPRHNLDNTHTQTHTHTHTHTHTGIRFHRRQAHTLFWHIHTL